MKILYYFGERNTPMFQWPRFHFIDELARHGIKIDIFNPLLYNTFEEAQECLLKQVNRDQYDLFMTVHSSEKKILRITLEEIKRKGIPTLLFTPDNLSIPFFDKQLAPLFDLVWLTAKETQHLYERWGAKTFFAPYAANPFVFQYKELPYNRSVCFIGTPHGSRPRVINEISRLSMPIDLYYGKNENSQERYIAEPIIPKYQWPKSNRINLFKNYLSFGEGRRILAALIMSKVRKEESVKMTEYVKKYSSLSFEKMMEAYSCYVLSLSFSSYGKTDYFENNVPVVNLRNFEIPMCGGIQFCRYSDEMANYYEDGKEVVYYHNKIDFADKLTYYINKATDSEIRKMKQSARFRSENENTWISRFRIVFDILGLKY